MTDQIYDLDALRSTCNKGKDSGNPSLDKQKHIVIFGAGGFGKNLYRILSSSGFKVSAFVETNPVSQFLDQIPVYKLTECPSELLNCQLVVGIFNRSAAYKEINDLVVCKGFKRIFFPWQVYEKFSTELGWRYWLSSPEIFHENKKLIEDAFLNLSDQESREIFIRIIKFRTGQDLNFSEYKSKETQYFNNITLKTDSAQGINYVDCGAYNGDTFVELAETVTINSAYLFEPDPVNYSKLVMTASTHPVQAFCLPLAVSDKHEILFFSGDAGESGALLLGGNTQVASIALDDVLGKSKVDFMKFDVEGGESKAIKGAENIIKNNSPILAISLYHRPSDLWELPLLISKLSKSYKLFIRQHWFNSFDSVLYAVASK